MREQYCGAAGAVLIGDDAALGGLDGRGGGEVNTRHLGVYGDKDNIGQCGVILPRGIDLALCGQVAGFDVVDGEVATTIHGEIEHAVRTAQGLAKLRVIKYGEGNAGQGGVIPSQYFATQYGGTLGFDGAGGDAGLNGVGTGIQKLGGGKDGGAHGAVNGRCNRGGVRRQASGGRRLHGDGGGLGVATPSVAGGEGERKLAGLCGIRGKGEGARVGIKTGVGGHT